MSRVTIFYHCRNLDIRDAILQLLNVIRDGSKTVDRHDRSTKEATTKIIKTLEEMGSGGASSKSFEKKIDNISTFLLRFCIVPASNIRFAVLVSDFA